MHEKISYKTTINYKYRRYIQGIIVFIKLTNLFITDIETKHKCP